jgi:Zn-dependent protease
MTLLFAGMIASVQKNPLATILLSKLAVLALGVIKQFILYIVCCFIALLAHEAMHAAIALALGVKVKKFGLSWQGPYLVRDPGSPRKNLLITVAGPLVNIILIATWFWFPTFAITNLLLAVSNMLPVHGSDGARACVPWMREKDSGAC